MELFLLGVGNYTEADVEAATAAWTGHTDDWETDVYVWRPEWHDNSTKTYLGRTINTVKTDAAQRLHGDETIDVMLDTGVVPAGASIAVNRGRPTRAVAAEFISRKLWTFFAGTTPPAAVITAMRTAATSNNFEIKPWVKAMLVRPEFYAPDVKQGLVRSPVDLMVAFMVATGLPGAATACPCGSWRRWGNARCSRPTCPAGSTTATSSTRAPMIRSHQHRPPLLLADDGGLLGRRGRDPARRRHHLARRGRERLRDDPDGLVDRILQLMRITATPTSRAALYTYSRNSQWWERNELIALALLMPEMHVA